MCLINPIRSGNFLFILGLIYEEKFEQEFYFYLNNTEQQ